MKDKAVVVGMGYVGIPLACLLAEAGHEVVGVDIIPERVKLLNQGKYPIRGDEPDLPELLDEQVKAGRLKASTRFSECKDAKVIFVCIDTPINVKKEPRYDHMMAAIDRIGENISSGALVVIESTIAPGTMRNEILPALERKSGLKGGKDIFLAHCPERVMSGRLLHNLRTLDRILGGLDSKSTEMAVKWYDSIMNGRIHTTDMTSAEVVKTAENAYRDVQIAFANEVGLICEALGLDAFEIRRLVNSCPSRDMHIPGAGVGGHCLPKDPWLLAYGGRKAKPRLIPMARQVNDSMPFHVAELAERGIAEAGLKKGRGTCIAVFGLAFLENSGDIRNSPSMVVLDRLKDRYKLIVHDPYVKEFEGVKVTRGIEATLELADCAIFMTRHGAYMDLSLENIARLMKHRIVIDGRNIFDGHKAKKLGIIYKGVAKG